MATNTHRRTFALLWRLPRPVLRVLAPMIPALLCFALLAAATTVRADDSPPPATATAPSRPVAAVNQVVAERLMLANSYLEKDRFDDALSVVDELAGMRKLKPVDHAQLHRFRGYILIAKGNTEEGGREFEAALAENALEESTSQGMIYSLAQIYTQAGKYDRARDLIDRWFAMATDPKPEAYFLKAMILVQQENYEEALEPARLANQRAPQPRESWLQLLAAVQFQLQDYASVAETLRQLVAVSPGTKRYWVQLATIENSLGKDDSALATLGVAHVGGLLSDDREYRQHARLCFVRELPQCCASTLEEGMAAGIVKRDAAAYQLLANCYIAARETDRALEPLAKAGELATDANGFLLLGQLQLQKDRFEAARDALQKAMAKSKPEQRGSIELLIGIAQLGSDRYDDAERSFRVAQADEKTRPAADSYLKHLEQRRALRALREPATVAGEEPGTPVSNASAGPPDSRL